MEKWKLSLYMESQGPRIANAVLTEINKAGGGASQDLKGTKHVQESNQHKTRHTNQQSRIESPIVNPLIYAELTFIKVPRTCSRKMSAS